MSRHMEADQVRRSRTASPPPTSEEQVNGRALQELVGFLWLLGGVILTVSLLSFDLADIPSRHFPANVTPRNTMGETGVTLSFFLFEWLGVIPAYFCALVMLYMGTKRFWGRRPPSPRQAPPNRSTWACLSLLRPLGVLSILVALATTEHLLAMDGLIDGGVLDGLNAGGYWGSFCAAHLPNDAPGTVTYGLTALVGLIGVALFLDRASPTSIGDDRAQEALQESTPWQERQVAIQLSPVEAGTEPLRSSTPRKARPVRRTARQSDTRAHNERRPHPAREAAETAHASTNSPPESAAHLQEGSRRATQQMKTRDPARAGASSASSGASIRESAPPEAPLRREAPNTSFRNKRNDLGTTARHTPTSDPDETADHPVVPSLVENKATNETVRIRTRSRRKQMDLSTTPRNRDSNRPGHSRKTATSKEDQLHKEAAAEFAADATIPDELYFVGDTDASADASADAGADANGGVKSADRRVDRPATAARSDRVEAPERAGPDDVHTCPTEHLAASQLPEEQDNCDATAVRRPQTRNRSRSESEGEGESRCRSEAQNRSGSENRNVSANGSHRKARGDRVPKKRNRTETERTPELRKRPQKRTAPPKANSTAPPSTEEILNELMPAEPIPAGLYEEGMRQKAQILTQALNDFKVSARVVSVERGPNVTRYELALKAGVKVNRIHALTDDIALALKATQVRIIAPIPGRSTVGVEVPNARQDLVRLRELIEAGEHKRGSHKIPLFLGKESTGEPLVTDLARMPHLLIAGSTGSGKSVCMNSIICSILAVRQPNKVKLILIDPKMVELSLYKKIPHLLAPVVTEMRRAPAVLEWAVEKMENRYAHLSRAAVRSIDTYNKIGKQGLMERLELSEVELEAKRIPWHMSYIVVVIDEFADLMCVARKEVETSIVRLAQKSRAVGIHLILATQRPTADVITGLIKSNMPCRLAFQVASKVDSRTILDKNGAECLMGQGDMLFMPPGTSALVRAQGTFLDDDEVKAVVRCVKRVGEPEYEGELTGTPRTANGGEQDELYDQAVRIVLESQRGSASLLQRGLKIGYSRASRLIDLMTDDEILGPFKGSKAREILISLQDWEARSQQ